MIDSILVILRDRGIPLPAGAILVSPWVDLTHSFPSLAEDGSLDYIPAQGFLNKPSLSWPPPNAEHLEEMSKLGPKTIVGEAEQRILDGKGQGETTKETQDSANYQCLEASHSAENLFHPTESQDAGSKSVDARIGPGHHLSINIKGETTIIKDQIQMYTTNQLLSHPLVSPVLQPSLGGLPPLLILTGGGELLRDEQIYLAHKAANPSKYPLGEIHLQKHPEAFESATRWRPTNVQLQVWDDLCHVAPALSFTKPAKYMYRSIAQFGAWCLARAQKTDIQIQDDEVSVIESSGLDPEKDQSSEISHQNSNNVLPGHNILQGQIGKAGSALPPFRNHMIRQRVDRHGNIYPLGPASSLPGLQVPPNEIGVIKPGLVLRWREAQDRWNAKFAREKRRIQIRRAKDMAQGFEGFGDDEVPPPSALAGRRRRNMPEKQDGKKPRSWGMSLWSVWGSSHDEKIVRITQLTWSGGALTS